MGMIKFLGIYSVFATAVLLTLSFFMLYSLRRIDSEIIRFFGLAIAGFLIICAIIMSSTGIYIGISERNLEVPLTGSKIEDYMEEMIYP